MSMSLDAAKAEVAIVRKIAMYEAMTKSGRLSEDACASLCANLRQELSKLKAVIADQGVLPIGEAKRK